MGLKDYPDNYLMTDLAVLKEIKKALIKKRPFSLVRIGDGENIVLAQNKMLSYTEVMNSYWVRQSESRKGKGVTLPCLGLRNKMIKAIKKATIVGICRFENDRALSAIYPSKLKITFDATEMLIFEFTWIYDCLYFSALNSG